MHRKIYFTLLFTGIFCSFFLQSSAQNKTIIAKTDKADRLFLINEFASALPIYLDLDKTATKDALTNYRIGVCYAHSSGDQLKALPYFEYALQNRNKQVPDKIHQYLGKLYHLTHRFDEAIVQFNAFRESLAKDDSKRAEVERQVQISRNAKLILAKEQDILIQNVGAPINTPYTEYGPVISADEGVLIYTSLKPATAAKKSATGTNAEYEDIAISHKKDGLWTSPASLGIGSKTNIGSVGLSPDGQHLLIYMGGQTNNGDIYSCQLQGDKWGSPAKLSTKINSNYQESSASLSPDQKVMYFASNRPGGQGGLDIYRIEKTASGEWGEPVNLGPTVNTPYDEDAPFIHPDGKTLFFSSNGHNTIGDNDIFKTTLNGNSWSIPLNMGYPINTVYNDSYFVLSADGKKGYFSSNRPGGLGGQDIYFLGIPEEQGIIPLTMMKGRIITGEKQVPTKIQVIDKATKEIVRNVYNPNSKTGQYLIIFPPGKSYDLLIEAEGFLPYIVNVWIPNQSHFYELYQEIHLKAIRQSGKTVGQEIMVKNVFQDVEQDPVNFDPAKFGENNLNLYELMESVIAASDSVALDYLLGLMYKGETIDLSNAPTEPVVGTYYYEDSEGKLQPVVIDGKTLYTLPPVNTTQPAGSASAIPEPIAEKQTITEKTVIRPNRTYIIYFDTDKTNLRADAMPELERVLDYLKENPEYAIKIAGYADADGTPERNNRISENRAKEVAKFLSSRSIAENRIIAEGFGQAPEATKKQTEVEKKMHRKAEIMFTELSKLK